MAKLSTYEKDNSISGEDLLAGSNYVSLNTYNTKNFKLADLVNFIEGQITISTQQATLKANGGLVVENINSTDQLAVNLSHTNITGQLANSDLVNSSITINGTAVSLGGSITIGEVTGVTAGTYLNGGGTEGTVTLNHDSTSRSDTTSNAAPAYGATFTAIDSITTNTTGHITAANLKTITIPASDDTNTTYTVEAIDDGNDAKIRLVGASPSSTDDVKLKAGSNITINVNEGTDEIEIVGTAFGNTFTVANETAHLALNTSSGDLVIRTDQSKTYIDNGTNASPNVMSNYTELQFSGIQQIDLAEGPGIDLEDHAGNAITTLTQNNNDLKVINTLATSSERGGIKIGYTESGKNYPVELDSEKAFVNVPWVNTTYTAGVGLVLTGTTFKADLIDETLRSVTAETITTTANRTYAVMPDADGDLVVNVPWVDTDNNTQNTYDISIPAATTKLRLTGAGHDGATTDDVEFVGSGATTVTRTNENKFTISSTDHNTEYTAGTGLTLTGTVFSADVDATQANSATNSLSTTASRYYAVQLDNNSTAADAKLVVNVPWTDNNDNTFRTIKVDTNDDGTANETIGATEELKLIGGTNVTLAENAGVVTITSTDTNTTNWNFKVDTGTAENIAAGNTVTFTGGTNVTLTQNGKTIDIAATNTTYTAGTGLSLSGTTFNANVDGTQTTAANTSTTTASRTYKVQVDDSDNLVVNVPWVDTDTDTNDNYYLDGISKSGNKLTFSVNGATDQEYTFGSNAFNSTTIPTNNNQITNGAGYITSYSETDTLATVTGRGNSTSTASTFSGGLTASGLFTSSGSGANAYSYFTGNAGSTNPATSFVHGLAIAWNNSGGSREFEHWWATGSDIESGSQVVDGSTLTGAALGQYRNRTSYMSWFNRYAPSGGTTVDTRMGKWYGTGEFELMSMSGLPGGGNTPTFSTPYIRLPLTSGSTGQVLTRKSNSTRDTEWTTPFSGSYNDLTNKPTIPTNNNQLTNGAGYITSFDITTQTDSKYLRSNADDTSSGSLTVVSYKFNGNASNPTNTTATIYDQSGVGLTASAHNFSIRNYNGSSMVESARFTTGSLTVIGDVIAFGTPSDISFKENIKPIENALDKVEKLQGVTFDWKESDSILDIKQDIGFIAQDVQKVLPELVRENDNGKLSLRHQGIISVLTEAIKELSDRIKILEDGNTN